MGEGVHYSIVRQSMGKEAKAKWCSYKYGKKGHNALSIVEIIHQIMTASSHKRKEEQYDQNTTKLHAIPSRMFNMESL